jgi:checkpoint serine/threonine-protein kinase
MANNGDLIDFGVIETQKENIQSLPGGRSAKSLASICSPLAMKKSPPLSETQNLKDTMRQEYEKELLAIAESDDPLDVYDRYIKWTMDAYPAAQATAESNLLPLLERATKTFLTSSHYKSDPRYLKMWLLYIRLFSDSPRETYAFIARHNVGESLALFYEEFAAWLESVGRWAQAEEVYLSGIDREARPAERLIRKFGEFQHRKETQAQQEDGPTSPALPKVRPALAAKVDPFAGAAAEENDPQAGDRAAAARPAKSGRKLAIFADGDEPPKPGSSDSSQGWDSIGSLGDRKKENTRG